MLAESLSQPTAATSKASSGSDSDFTRLHISPLDAEIAKILIPASLADKARDISFHTIETFPERRYGYVELPTMEAEKLKKKFSGTTLKGNKIRVEKARPQEIIEPAPEKDEADVKDEKRKSKRAAETFEARKKRKRDPDVVEGIVLTDRKVKRGWTEPADQRRKKSKKDKETDKEGKTTDKKKRSKSVYTEDDECLLKTKVPAEAVANITVDNLPRKHRKKSKARDIIVHEFEKTTKFPSFLKNSVPESDSKPPTKFIDGQGWADEDGNVVEVVVTRKSPEPKPKKVKKKVAPPPVEEDDDDSTSSSGTSSSGSSDEESEDESEEEKTVTPKKDRQVSNAEESSEQPEHSTPISAIKADSSRPMSSGSSRSLTIKIPPPPTTPSATTVHPLEALYKRSKPDIQVTETPAQEAQPFSFFGGNQDDNQDNAEPAATPAPMTPFSRQDFDWRNVRSAAPTPDTAHPSRMKILWAQEEEQEEEDADMADALQEAYQEEEEGDDVPAQTQATSSSDFQTWFWDNRRDLNRSWMKRRKTAAKEKRHRENKARASKAV